LWVKLTPLERNRRLLVDSKTYQKVQLTLIGSPLRAFQWA